MNKNTILIGALVGVVIALGVGFFAGLTYEKSKASATMMAQNGGGTGASGQNGAGRFGRGGQGGAGGAAGAASRPVSGQVISSDAKSVTIKLSDGSSKIILLGSSTPITKSSAGSTADLTAGQTVTVFGTTNPDGSITAMAVQVGMAGMNMRSANSQQPNSGQKSADATEIVVTGSNYKFDHTTITIPKGQKTRIVFKVAEGAHDFRIDGLNVGTAVVQSGQQDWFEFTPTTAGTYQYYCSVGNHRQMGMVGTLTVQ